MKPFLKWVGGKQRLIPQYEPHIPSKINRYIEPFMGGTAMFFHLVNRLDRPALLSDTNPALVACYNGLRHNVELVIKQLRQFKTDRETFEAVRSHPPNGIGEDAYWASWVIYLNRCCYNGLWRVNRKGEFNVPYGSYATIQFDEGTLRACANALQLTELDECDFEKSIAKAGKGDLVYCDPPYLATFDKYAKGGWSLGDNENLRHACETAVERGANVLISQPLIAESLWKDAGWNAIPIAARHNVSCGDRPPIKELLISVA